MNKPIIRSKKSTVTGLNRGQKGFPHWKSGRIFKAQVQIITLLDYASWQRGKPATRFLVAHQLQTTTICSAALSAQHLLLQNAAVINSCIGRTVWLGTAGLLGFQKLVCVYSELPGWVGSALCDTWVSQKLTTSESQISDKMLGILQPAKKHRKSFCSISKMILQQYSWSNYRLVQILHFVQYLHTLFKAQKMTFVCMLNSNWQKTD